MTSRLLSPDDVAADLRVPVRSARRYMLSMVHLFVGRHLLVTREAFEARKAGAPAPPPDLSWLSDAPVDGHVYFAQGQDGGPIKIGYSRETERRLRELQRGSPVPLRMLRVVPGSRALEIALHAHFSSDRLHGEWFAPTSELLRILRLGT